MPQRVSFLLRVRVMRGLFGSETGGAAQAQPYHAYASQSVHQQPGMQPMQGSSYSTPSTLMHAKQPSPGEPYYY